jgi:transglutaminase-like putative cysteine protease
LAADLDQREDLMRRHLIVRHTTEYHYAEPVSFGRHRMMFRPRDSHSLWLLNTELSITPAPASIRWMYDAFGNSVSYAEFGDERAICLRFVSEIDILHYEAAQPTDLLLDSAQRFPFAYDADEVPDLQSVMRVHRPDPDGQLAEWAVNVARSSDGGTLSVLVDMMETIHRDFVYLSRPKAGTQEPAQTLALGTGSCRDFALLMIEALRSLGFAARFVTGYIYTPRSTNHQGGGATHAWLQVYLPGCGWVEMDPTNGIFGNRDLIRIAVARDHRQAVPLSGSFVGTSSAFLGMSVSVSVIGAEAETALA